MAKPASAASANRRSTSGQGLRLSDSEIAQIYNGGTGASIGSLIPEPSGAALFGSFGVLALLRRRR